MNSTVEDSFISESVHSVELTGLLLMESHWENKGKYIYFIN